LLGRSAAAADLGVPLDRVLDDLARSEPGLAPACASLRVGLRAGGDLPRALDRLAQASADQARVRGELSALTAPVRLSGVILGALPIASLLLFGSTSPEQTKFFRESLGQVVLAVGLILDAAGVFVLAKLARPAGAR
jgi:Flp pilus assembly protein TadB